LLICPGVFANHGTWGGLSLGGLLAVAQAHAEAGRVTVTGAGGKRVDYPLEDVLGDRVFLAYQVNGGPLPVRHGYPLRVVAEGYYGYDWVKYAQGIEVA
jgi:DMSO/TMAO reductase YedYZ molybdopterin-dependent catalytic subunit